MSNLDDNQSVYLDQTFKNAQLLSAEIHAKEFDNCIFSDCNFSETQFINCKFYECKFINCNLSLITVKGCSFFDVVFEDSKLVGVNWTQAAWPRIKLSSPFQFYKCILNHSSFFGLSLKELILTECSAKEVDFRETDCTEANFTYTDFTKSLFNKTKLTQADLSEAKNYHIDIFHNEIKKAKFSLPEVINLLHSLDIELVN